MDMIRPIVWAAAFAFALALALHSLSSDAWGAERDPKASSAWHLNRVASWYSMPGNRTACGQTMTSSSWWVAALQTENMRCGLQVYICHNGRCVRVRVLDRGANRNDRRDWDLTPRVRRALRCSSLCDHINWRRRLPGEPAW